MIVYTSKLSSLFCVRYCNTWVCFQPVYVLVYKYKYYWINTYIHETITCMTIHVLWQYLKHNTCFVLQYVYCVTSPQCVSSFRGHQRSKIFSLFESPYMTSYLTSINTFSLSRTVFEIFNFKVFRVWPWPLTSRGHLRSKIFSPFESPYRTSYLTSIDTFSLSRTVFEIFDF